MILDAPPCRHLDQLRQRTELHGAELPRLALQRVRRYDQRHGITAAHGRFDRCYRLDPILAEISENPDEIAAEFVTRALISGPLDDAP